MEVFEMVVAIVALATVAKVLNTWLKQRGKARRDGAVSDKDFAEMLKRLDAAEARISVLEKLATDADRGLAAEIDQLSNSDAAKSAAS